VVRHSIILHMPHIHSHAPGPRRAPLLIVSVVVAMVAIFAGTLVALRVGIGAPRGTVPALAIITIKSPSTTPFWQAITKPADQAAILDVTPSTIPCDTPNAHSDPRQINVVINKKHCLSPRSFAPSDLVTIGGATLTSAAASAFGKMADAAAAAGVPLSVTSSYRSYQSQVSTYNTWVAQNGSADAADKVSARPGYSEHQTGLALDLAAGSCGLECFTTTAQSAWLITHAADYGFINRYPRGAEAITGYSPEPWHYRYVGVAVAQDMTARGIPTLEQYWNITGGDY